ncbi:MAG: hypothetical protein KC777_13490 [Cyanobacteria bacterium HKST-UBA02]|nr:hypothetical protein [Cyanobacteria bacterium HKST-UBA02]
MNTRITSIVSTILLCSSFIASPALAEDMSWPSEDSPDQAKKAAPSESEETPRAASATPVSGLSGKLEMEKPQVDSSSGSSGRTPTLRAGAKSVMLYGRLDQIASEADVKMPVLKAETAQLDTRDTRLRAGARETTFSGSVAQSFPVDFSGTWGGKLGVWRYNASSLSDQIDPNESRRMAQILQPGKSGTVNFVFRQEGRSIELEPAKVRILIPAQESYSYQKMLSSNQLGGMGSMVKGMMANMKIPVILHFGSVSTSGSAEVGVSGNQIDQRVVKNVIRQLAPRVIEEQIVTRNRSVVAGSGAVENGYTETVMRFTRQSPSDLYVIAASVDYTDRGQFLRKLIMYGTVVRGQVMNTSPVPDGMGQLSSLMGGGGAGGAAGLGSISGLSRMLSAVGGAGGAGGYGGNYGSNYATSGSYGGGAQNYGAMLRSLQQSGLGAQMGGPGGIGGRTNGFSQVMQSLNMLSR